MADPDPNDKVTLAGSGVLLHVQRADGEIVPVQGTDAGAINTASGGGGGLIYVNDGGTPVAVDKYPGIEFPESAACVAVMNTVITQTAPAQLVSAAPAAGTQAQAVYLVDGTTVSVGNTPNVTARQGSAGVDPWLVSGPLTDAQLRAASVPVSGTFWQATQPVSAASLPLPAGAATSALQGAGLPNALTAGGGVKVGLVDALPAGSNAIGSVTVSALPGSPAQEHITAASPHAARLTDGSAFYVAAQAGDNLGADLRVSGAAVANANPVPVSDAGGSLTVDGSVSISGTPAVTVSSGSITEANSSTIATNTGRIPAQGQALAAASMPVVLPLSQAGGALALDSTLTGGTAKAIARGGDKGATTAADVTSTAQGTDHQALDVQIYHGGAAKDPTQIRALTASDVVSADLRVSSAAVTHANPAPVITARSTHRTPGSTLSAAATSHVLSSSPGTLRRVEWRYTGAGTKYIVLCDQAGGTAAAANWTGWYASMSNGAGKSYFEFPEGIRCASGIVLGVSATEPQANVAITLSSNANENFTPTFWSIQP